jgi:hypothetical protein
MSKSKALVLLGHDLWNRKQACQEEAKLVLLTTNSSITPAITALNHSWEQSMA